MKFRDYLKEKVDMQWLIDNVTGKKYKGKVITNSVYDDKEGKMVRFWVKDGNKTVEIRPMPKDELIKVLKEATVVGDVAKNPSCECPKCGEKFKPVLGNACKVRKCAACGKKGLKDIKR